MQTTGVQKDIKVFSHLFLKTQHLNYSSVILSPIPQTSNIDSLFDLDCKTGTTPETESVIKRLGGGAGVQCIFPFTLEANNKTYHSCTYDFMHVTGYQPWCSTKVDKNGVHMRDVGEDVKNWGICTDASSCPIPPRRK